MMVHRVENTLLIDEFDVHKYLMVKTEDDWEWLRKFFYNHILESFDRKVRLFLYCYVPIILLFKDLFISLIACNCIYVMCWFYFC